MSVESITCKNCDKVFSTPKQIKNQKYHLCEKVITDEENLLAFKGDLVHKLDLANYYIDVKKMVTNNLTLKMNIVMSAETQRQFMDAHFPAIIRMHTSREKVSNHNVSSMFELYYYTSPSFRQFYKYMHLEENPRIYDGYCCYTYLINQILKECHHIQTTLQRPREPSAIVTCSCQTSINS